MVSCVGVGIPGAIRCHSSTSCDGAYNTCVIKNLWARVTPRLQDVATGGIGDSFIFYSAPQDFMMLGVFCARFPLLGRLVFFVNYKEL